MPHEFVVAIIFGAFGVILLTVWMLRPRDPPREKPEEPDTVKGPWK